MLVARPTSLKMAAAAVSNLPMCRRTSEPELSLNYDPCSPLGGNACLRSVPWKKSYSKQEHESRILTKGRCRTNIQCVQSPSSTLEYSNKTETPSTMLSASDAPGFQIAAEKAEMLGRTNDVMLAGSNNQHGDKRPSLEQIIKPVEEDLRILNNNLQSIVGAQNALLTAAAEQIFSAGGKRMRPAIVLLVSKATSDIAGHKDLTTQHRRLAEITEMIHTASLIHDDVLDESSVRRGKETLHQLYGTRIAVLAGDFMFAQSSWYLANLENLEVIKLISEVIKDFANGEIQQAASLFDCDLSLEDYLDKSYYKTASLIAASTRSASIFSHVDSYIHDQMFLYGKHLGLAFQIVDDILDFTQSTGQLGKPAGSDLIKGNLTAPVLFALETQPELRALIETEFTDNGSLDAAISLVKHGGGIDKARELARQKANLALQNLQCLPKGPAKLALEEMVGYVLERAY